MNDKLTKEILKGLGMRSVEVWIVGVNELRGKRVSKMELSKKVG